MSLDKTKIKPIPIQKTLSLINNFVISSTSFFNTFTENVETKISKISNKITELEILLAVLEAKLNSVPGIDIPVEQTPQQQPASQKAEQKSEIPLPQQDILPELNTSQQEYNESYSMPPPSVEEPQPVADPIDRSKYVEFEKFLKVGVPTFVVRAKVIAAGLDPTVLGLEPA